MKKVTVIDNREENNFVKLDTLLTCSFFVFGGGSELWSVVKKNKDNTILCLEYTTGYTQGFLGSENVLPVEVEINIVR